MFLMKMLLKVLVFCLLFAASFSKTKVLEKSNAVKNFFK